MTFHLMTTGDDEFGIAPTVFAHLDGRRDRKTWQVDAGDLAATPARVPLEQDTLMQGPPRHLDRVAWIGDGAPHGAYFIVSARVHTLFQEARLPRHLVKAVQIRFGAKHHRRCGAAETTFYMYSFSSVDLIDIFDLTKTELSCTVRLLTERQQHDHRLAAGSVHNGSTAWTEAAKRVPDQRPWVTPAAFQCSFDGRFRPEINFDSQHFPLHIHDLDLIFLDHHQDPFVSDALRDALLQLEVTGHEVRRVVGHHTPAASCARQAAKHSAPCARHSSRCGTNEAEAEAKAETRGDAPNASRAAPRIIEDADLNVTTPVVRTAVHDATGCARAP